MDGWMDGWMGGWVDGWMGGWMDGWMDGWVDGWMDGWMGGWIQRQPYLQTGVHEEKTDEMNRVRELRNPLAGGLDGALCARPPRDVIHLKPVLQRMGR